MEQQGPTGLTEGQIAHLVEDDEIHVHEPMCQLPGLTLSFLGLQQIDQLDGREEAPSGSRHLHAGLIDGVEVTRHRQVMQSFCLSFT